MILTRAMNYFDVINFVSINFAIVFYILLSMSSQLFQSNIIWIEYARFVITVFKILNYIFQGYRSKDQAWDDKTSDPSIGWEDHVKCLCKINKKTWWLGRNSGVAEGYEQAGSREECVLTRRWMMKRVSIRKQERLPYSKVQKKLKQIVSALCTLSFDVVWQKQLYKSSCGV